ncbi:glycoside hydrolase family 6 protein [Bifidobacterium oedipodis]|uniref:glycoside hydrolase family 6 protein n=1 Tax=Bifidobacterium oedipodis TaxID=2675322 RepID=UPI00145CCD87
MRAAVAAVMAGLLCALSTLFIVGSGAADLYMHGLRRDTVSADGDNPFTDRVLYVDDDSSAAHAAEDKNADETSRAAAAQLASVPSSIWLEPDKLPPTRVGPAVTAVMKQAAYTGTMPVFVVYGIPGRDCGGYSASDMRDDEYVAWVQEIVDAVSAWQGVVPAVIVEPDALAMMTDCPALESKMPLLTIAVRALATSGAAVYIDAGHSGWVDAETMASLLLRAGVENVRGFSLNVSNYNVTAAERAYGEQLSQLTGGRYVIDTSRNGNGHGNEPDSAWCNVSGARVGEEPGATTYGAQDAALWIKTPGESDGTCNAGPQAGQWWPEQAESLLGWS